MIEMSAEQVDRDFMTDDKLRELLDARDELWGCRDSVRVFNCVLVFGGVAKMLGMSRGEAIAIVKNLGKISADILVGLGVLTDDRRACPRCSYRF